MVQEVLEWRHPATIRPPQKDSRQRRDPEFLRMLGEDIRRRGMRQPICCRPVDKDDLEVVSGETRRQAALLAGVDSIPVRVIHDELPPGALLLEQLLENDLRHDFTYVERVTLYAALMQANQWTQAQLAHAIGRSPGEVNKFLSIKGRLPQDLIDKIQSGVLPVSVGYLLSKLNDQSQMREIAQRYEMGDLSRDGVEGDVARRRGSRTPKAKLLRVKDGNVTIQLPGDWTWEQLGLLGQRFVDVAKRGEKHSLPFLSLPSIYRKE